jgi:hypothetical protein
MRRISLYAGLLGLALGLPLVAAADEAPGVFKVPGTETTIKFNGFIETTLFYQFSGGAERLASACDYYQCAPSIALKGTTTPAQTAMTSAYSRFGVQTSTPSAVGQVGTRFEVDAAKGYQLIGASDTHSSSIRIRHAYGTVGDWFLMGQTWSTFGDLAAFPDQIDENPFFNLAALRAPMIRLSAPVGPTKFTVALEDPYATSAGVPTPYWQVPDLIARFDVPAGNASFSVRGVLKQYKNATASTVGGGAAASAALKFGADSLVVDVSGGPGLGTYQYGTTTNVNVDAGQDAIQSGTSFKLWKTYGASVGFTHVWSAAVRSNLMGSGLWTSDDNTIKNAINAAVAAGALKSPYGDYNKEVYSGSFNTVWAPAKTFWLGAEFYYNYRKTFAGDHGDEFRGELVSHFDFM